MNTRMIIGRLVQLALIVAGVSVVVFFMLRLIPGDPARLLLGEYASPDALAALRVQLGLHQSLPVQYWILVKHMLTGNFGNSYRLIFAVIMALINLAVDLLYALIDPWMYSWPFRRSCWRSSSSPFWAPA
jgi:ABC-type dipeptide/oligopeptide/nickel transport system permease component